MLEVHICTDTVKNIELEGRQKAQTDCSAPRTATVRLLLCSVCSQTARLGNVNCSAPRTATVQLPRDNVRLCGLNVALVKHENI